MKATPLALQSFIPQNRAVSPHTTTRTTTSLESSPKSPKSSGVCPLYSSHFALFNACLTPLLQGDNKSFRKEHIDCHETRGVSRNDDSSRHTEPLGEVSIIKDFRIDTSGVRPQYNDTNTYFIESARLTNHTHPLRFWSGGSKSANEGYTHPLTPSAREGEQNASTNMDCHEFSNENSRNDKNAKSRAIAHANSSILDEKSGLCSFSRGDKAKTPIAQAKSKLPDFSLKDEFAQRRFYA